MNSFDFSDLQIGHVSICNVQNLQERLEWVQSKILWTTEFSVVNSWKQIQQLLSIILLIDLNYIF